MKTHLADFLIRSAERFPEKPALIHGATRLSYREIHSRAESIGSWLTRQGLAPGFRGGILTDEPAAYVSWYFGILLAGGIVIGLNTQTTARSLGSVLRDAEIAVLHCRAKYLPLLADEASFAPALMAVVSDGNGSAGAARVVSATEVLEYPGRLPAAADRSSGKIAQFIYTSGTTGEPKGVMLSHGNLAANTTSILEYLGLTAEDRAMAILPFFYSYGNSVMLTHIAAGGTLVVNQNFLYPNVVLEEMVREGATGFSGVPSTFAILLHRSNVRNHAFPALRYLTQAGGPMSPALAGELRRVFPGVRIYIMYGQTEASARLSYLDPRELDRKPGSIGKAIPGVTLRVRDPQGRPVCVGEVGEIVASGRNIMAGYWKKPEETARVLRGGELWTGDLARVDDEGFLFIVGRQSEMIKSGSHRIAPKEIEDVLLEHGSVHEAAVVGVPDEILGESIRAYVVRRPEKACTDRELILHCRRILPAFKTPQAVVFLEQLPRTPTGKVRKVDLR